MILTEVDVGEADLRVGISSNDDSFYKTDKPSTFVIAYGFSQAITYGVYRRIVSLTGDIPPQNLACVD